METAVYSGSFNPLHIGHLAILRRLAELYDRVLLVVSPINPLKATATSLDAQVRLDAARAALARHPELSGDIPSCTEQGCRPLRGKVRVSDIEFRLPTPNYTIDTLDALKSENPSASLPLVVGGDQIADFRRWKDYRRILTDYGAAVFPREGFDTAAIRSDLLRECPRYRIRLINMPLVPVSSTQIREALASGKDVSTLLM